MFWYEQTFPYPRWGPQTVSGMVERKPYGICDEKMKGIVSIIKGYKFQLNRLTGNKMTANLKFKRFEL